MRSSMPAVVSAYTLLVAGLAIAASPSVESLEKRLAEKDNQLKAAMKKASDEREKCSKRPPASQQKCQMDAANAFTKSSKALTDEYDAIKKQLGTARIDARNAGRAANGGLPNSPNGKYVGFWSLDRVMEVAADKNIKCGSELARFVTIPKRQGGELVLPPHCGSMGALDPKGAFCVLNTNAGSFFAANYWRDIFVGDDKEAPQTVMPECLWFAVGGYQNSADVEFKLAILDFLDEAVAGGHGGVSVDDSNAPNSAKRIELKEWFRLRETVEAEPRAKSRLSWLAGEYSSKGEPAEPTPESPAVAPAR